MSAETETETERQSDDRQEVLDRLPSRRPASLYDVAVQHAAIDWYTTVTSGELDFELDPKHLSFMTPMEKDELYEEPDNVLVANVDLTDPDNPKVDEETPVEIRTIDEGYRFRLGHSYPANKTSSMTDYSITTQKSANPHHLSGLRDDAWGTNNIQDRFTDWAQSDAAQEVVEEDDVETAWVVEALAEIGDDEEAMERLVEEFPLDTDDEDTEHDVFVTVRVKLPDSDEYQYPGEIPALNEVMAKQKAERFENISVDNAGGEGVGYISGDEERVTGGSAGLLGMYAKKQREHFPDLPTEGSDAWRSRPLTHETAAAIATANSLFEEFYRGLGEGRRLYVLPYIASHPESIDPATVDWFATEVFDELRSAEQDEFEDEVEELYRKVNDAARGDEEEADGWAHEGESYADVRFATVFFVSGNPDRIYFESMSPEATYRPSELEDAHVRVLKESEYVDDGILSDLVENSESSLLNSEATLRRMIIFGGYFDRTTEPTANSEDASGQPKAGDIDDVRARRMRSFLTGETVSYDTLFEEYLHRIVQEQRSAFGDDSRNVPSWAIAEQYTQLRALERCGVVGEDGSEKLDTETMTPQESPVPEDGQYESRTERLNEFIENHPVLGDESKLAVFLLGGLVGRLSTFQRQKDVSSTLVRRYPVDYITKQSIKEVTAEVIEMNNTYIEAYDETSSGMNARYTNRLPNLMLSADPSGWKFPQNEIQWLYALGITYGTNDTSVREEE